MTTRDDNRFDRIAGTFIGLACGDALGAGYEFGPPIPYGTEVSMRGGGPFNWPAGHWTDDTDMAVAIAFAAIEHGGLASEAAMDSVVRRWVEWVETAPDVGAQTRAVLTAVAATPTAAAARAAAARHHSNNGGMSAGNGSLMRTAPVALAFLDDLDAMWAAAQEISALTHHDPEAGEACALWCHAIAHAMHEGDYAGMHAGLERLPTHRRDHWAALIAEAETSQPWRFHRNGWVRHAFQAAWCAVASTPEQPLRPELHIFPAQSAAIAIERAVRAGYDTDTVAAIAGSLVGARWGLSGLPTSWTRRIHSGEGLRANHLQQLALQVARREAGGAWRQAPDISGWTMAGVTGRVASQPSLHLFGQQALRDADLAAASVVSLSRVGVAEVADAAAHVPVFVIDSADEGLNPNLHFSLWDVARTLSELLAETDKSEGSRVILHCVQAQNRTPTFAVAYLVTQCGYTFEEAV
ncbi:MAG: ADP-ribosylglycohydrolase family protein, partial [Actinomycetales bacterium]|nr:ADP-ribosylglycohydrolase family protein [Actinomycetales bacterium]